MIDHVELGVVQTEAGVKSRVAQRIVAHDPDRTCLLEIQRSGRPPQLLCFVPAATAVLGSSRSTRW